MKPWRNITSVEQEAFMSAEATAYFPKANEYNSGPDGYLELIREGQSRRRLSRSSAA